MKKFTIVLALALFTLTHAQKAPKIVYADLGVSMKDVTFKQGSVVPRPTVTVSPATFKSAVLSAIDEKLGVTAKEAEEKFNEKDLWEHVELIRVKDLDVDKKRGIMGELASDNKLTTVAQIEEGSDPLLVAEGFDDSVFRSHFGVRVQLKEIATKILKVRDAKDIPDLLIHGVPKAKDPDKEGFPKAMRHVNVSAEVKTAAVPDGVDLETVERDAVTGDFKLDKDGNFVRNESDALRFGFTYTANYAQNPFQILTGRDRNSLNTFEATGTISTVQLDKDAFVQLAWRTDNAWQWGFAVPWSEFSVRTSQSTSLSSVNFGMGIRLNDKRANAAGESDKYISLSDVRTNMSLELGLMTSYAIPRGGLKDVPPYTLRRGSLRPLARLKIGDNDKDLFSIYGEATIFYLDRSLGPAENRNLRFAEQFKLGARFGTKNNKLAISYDFGRDMSRFEPMAPVVGVTYTRKF